MPACARSQEFCRFGDPRNTGKMTGTKFFKFAKDCKLTDATVTRTRIDMLFTKTKAKGARTISFGEFKTGVEALAEMKFGKGPKSTEK